MAHLHERNHRVSLPTNSTLILENISATNNGPASASWRPNIAGQAPVSSLATLTVLIASADHRPARQPRGRVWIERALQRDRNRRGAPVSVVSERADIFGGDHNGTYTVTNAQSGDEGAYSVVASNLAGIATSPPATLTVEYRPVLESPGMKTVNELTLLTFTVTADTDVPTDGLAFTLDGAPPPGASISASGEFRWLPTERQGPGDYSFTVRATDQGTLRLSGTTTFAARVNEVNVPPDFVDTAHEVCPSRNLAVFPHRGRS
jgi:hypothetical protein